MDKHRPYALMAILAALFLAGLAAIFHQWSAGMAETSLHEPVVWGLYVVCFAYFTGIGAGALLIASAAISSDHTKYRLVGKVASAVALVSLITAGLFITLDLGRPERAWMLMVKAMPKSPLTWDFFILNILLLVAALFALMTFRYDVIEKRPPTKGILRLLTIGHRQGRPASIPVLVRRLAGLMIPGTLILYVLTARVFSSLQARPEWNTPGLAPLFLLSALLSGLAAVVVVTELHAKRQGKDSLPSDIRRVAINVLLVLLAADLIVSLAPLATIPQWGSPAPHSGPTHVGGVMIVEILLGLILPLAVLCVTRAKRTAWTVPAGILILAGVFLKRWHIIIPAMLRRSLPLSSAAYLPSLLECTISVGLLAFAALALILIFEITTIRTEH